MPVVWPEKDAGVSDHMDALDSLVVQAGIALPCRSDLTRLKLPVQNALRLDYLKFLVAKASPDNIPVCYYCPDRSADTIGLEHRPCSGTGEERKQPQDALMADLP